ncbi:ubiquinol oxidase subunit II [Aureimonas mangrovi]|uniref:ubiquinol oxidase subunit II n=1 Tax=Aureimonas mangrovi TaxID=2758041 RepID=UPI00163D648A|nr:ubiquinol oxidase subunit II [Aureimonas mangrovi]
MPRFSKLLIVPLLALILSGCNAVVMAPAGDVAMQQRDLIVISTVLMLIIIIPVMVLTVVFARKYRASNKDAVYEPDWDHSTRLELVIWAAPLAIIICLGAVTWVSTHLLDPYRELARVGPGRLVEENTQPLEVEVVALDWKWMFIYPQYDIATVNEFVAPVDRPISFKLTSSTVMNSFYIPAMAGQIYAMPGMQTRLHGVLNNEGEYRGIAAHFSGRGFSGMRYPVHAVDDAAFDEWVETVRGSDDTLDRARYLEVAQPSENVPTMHFSGVEDDLYTAILNMCVERDKMCMSEMMAIDRSGGLGLAGLVNTVPERYAGVERNPTPFGQRKTYVAAICTVEEAMAMSKVREPVAAPSDMSPLQGKGLGDGSAFASRRTPLLEMIGFGQSSTHLAEMSER